MKNILILLALSGLFACTSLSPTHVARFDFSGTIKDQSGKPIRNARIKVRGWETITDQNGRWRQEQVVECGALREKVIGFEEDDAVLITAPGFDSHEEPFKVIRPRWFASCRENETKIAFDTVLKLEGSANASHTKQFVAPNPDEEAVPQVPATPRRDTLPRTADGVSL